MKASHTSVSLALVAIGAALLPGVSHAQATIPSTPPVLAPEAPASELWQKGAPTVKFGTSIYRDVYCRVVDKVVSFEWRYATPQLPSSDNVKDLNSEVFATRYWPTFAVPLDPYRLCIAGKARTGETVLELWQFDAQSSSGTPAPSVSPLFPQGGGPAQYSWTLPPRSGVELVLNTPDTAPQGLIRALFPNLGASQRVFVYYDSSRELYSVDLPAKTQALVGSPSGAAGSMSIPALANGYDRYWAADYIPQGYCYFFAAVYVVNGTPEPPALVLVDSGRDGTIDSSLTLTGAEWIAGGWGDAANIAPPPW